MTQERITTLLTENRSYLLLNMVSLVRGLAVRKRRGPFASVLLMILMIFGQPVRRSSYIGINAGTRFWKPMKQTINTVGLPMQN